MEVEAEEGVEVASVLVQGLGLELGLVLVQALVHRLVNLVIAECCQRPVPTTVRTSCYKPWRARAAQSITGRVLGESSLSSSQSLL